MGTFAIGDRVRVKDDLPGVCAYLWGHVGTIEEIRTHGANGEPIDEAWGERHGVRFDEPHPASGRYHSMPFCRLKARHLEAVAV